MTGVQTCALPISLTDRARHGGRVQARELANGAEKKKEQNQTDDEIHQRTTFTMPDILPEGLRLSASRTRAQNTTESRSTHLRQQDTRFGVRMGGVNEPCVAARGIGRRGAQERF